MISGNPSRLHIYAPGTQTDTIVALPKVPLSLSVSPDGLFAAVGHDSLVSYVNLSTGVIDKSFVVSITSPTVILASNWVYVLTALSNQSSVSVNLATGTATSPNNFGYYFTPGGLNVNANAIYGTRDGLSPNDVVKITVASGPMTAQTDSIYHGDYPACGPTFFSADQSRIYTGCGTIYRASTDPTLDMRYVGNLPGTTRFKTLSESVSKRIAVVPILNGSDESSIYLYESDFLNQIATFKMPPFAAGANSFAAHGRALFFNAAGTMLYSVEQADLTSGILDDYRLRIITLANPAPCGATFATTSAQVIGDGAIGSVNINSSADCIYDATSQSPWMDIVSGGYGSGNNVLKYIVRANTGAARQGSLSLGSGSTLTIDQAAATSPGPFTRLPYNVVSAAYAESLQKLILVSAAPNELHIYDPETRADQKVVLAMPPLSLSVRPDGLFAAVGHDGWVSYVDLQTATVQQKYSVITDVSSIVLAGNGYAYLFPARDWSDIYSLHLASGTNTATNAIYDGRIPRLYADGNYMYVGGNWFSKWSIGAGVASLSNNVTSVGTCGNLWLTEDGKRMITACGGVYRTSSVPSEDMQANGSFPNTTVVWADQASIPHQTALLARTNSNHPGAAELRLDGDAFLQLASSSGMHPFLVGNANFSGYGQFVFWNTPQTKLIVVEKADSTANLLSSYGVFMLTPNRKRLGQITSQ